MIQEFWESASLICRIAVIGGLVLVAALIVCGVIALITRRNRKVRKEARLLTMSAADFLKKYGKWGKVQQPGCYVVLCCKEAPKPSTIKAGKGYRKAYIGTSRSIYPEIRKHLTGHGNKAIAAYGTDCLYVVVVASHALACERELQRYRKAYRAEMLKPDKIGRR